MQIDVPQGQFTLRREPHQDRSPLRAWDAADEYVLHHLAEHDIAGDNWLIANDAFGALSVVLADHKPQLWADSCISHIAAQKNLDRNGLALDAIGMVPSTETPAGPIDVVIMKVPRANALLEHQLRTLRPLLHAKTAIVGAAMVKRLPRSAIDLFDEILGPTTTSLARKKARLIHTTVDLERNVAGSPYPTTFTVSATELGDTTRNMVITNHANVFSRSQLDIGTRVLLANLPPVDAGATVVDLGCGNGIVGARLGQLHPEAKLIYTDVSHMAIASARATHDANCAASTPAPHADFRVADGLGDADAGTADVVVVNPPFHNDNVVGDAIAWQMFNQAHRALRTGGELRVVANRHLGYHTKLKRIFGNCDTVASTSKFVVLRSVR